MIDALVTIGQKRRVENKLVGILSGWQQSEMFWVTKQMKDSVEEFCSLVHQSILAYVSGGIANVKVNSKPRESIGSTFWKAIDGQEHFRSKSRTIVSCC